MLAMTSLATRTEPNDPLLPIQGMLPPDAPSARCLAVRVVQSGPVGSPYFRKRFAGRRGLRLSADPYSIDAHKQYWTGHYAAYGHQMCHINAACSLHNGLMKRTTERGVRRRQLDRRLAPARQIGALAPPEGGWIRSIRQSLGMSTRQLAQRIGVERATAADFERSEAAGTITLKSLEKVASGLGATLIYSLVPTKSLDTTLRDQATEKADQLFARVSTTMGLEQQDVDRDAARDSRDDVVERLIRELPRDLWNP